MQGKKNRKIIGPTVLSFVPLPGKANVRTKGNWIVSERDLLGKSKATQKAT